MLRKTNSQKGFTIIEVVITIAIGAAVMALVLNAVAGARRSQRNNARSADVNKVAAGINQYIATRNQLPANWVAIQQIVDPSKFGHYDKDITAANASINPVSASAIKKGPVTTITIFAVPDATTINTASALTEDEVVVMREASCVGTTSYKKGGIREMAILYKLEGQTDVSCLEI